MTNNAIKGPTGVPAIRITNGVFPTLGHLVPTEDPNWKSQKTRRKNWRRVSNSPKAVRRRLGFKERRG